VFPKKDHLSIGVCGHISQVKKLKPYCNEYIQQLDLGDYVTAHIEAHSVAFRRRKAAIQKDRVLLLGDAAGLCDPLTGEGIYYAIKSAKMAAPVIADFIDGRVSSLSGYELDVDRQLMPDLNLAYKVAQVLAMVPRFGLNMVMRDIGIWEASCDVLCGEKSYTELRREMEGSRMFKTALGIWKRINR
jgi:flavin-dependent dehydrogenase